MSSAPIDGTLQCKQLNNYSEIAQQTLRTPPNTGGFSDFPSSMKSQPQSLHLKGGAWTVSGHCVQIRYISEEGPVWRRDHGPLPGQCHQGRGPRKAPHHCCHPHLLHPSGGAGVGVSPQLPPVIGACTLSQFSHCTCIWPAMEREVAAGHVALPGGLSHPGSCISSGLELLCTAAMHGETSSARMLRGLDVRWKAASDHCPVSTPSQSTPRIDSYAVLHTFCGIPSMANVRGRRS